MLNPANNHKHPNTALMKNLKQHIHGFKCILALTVAAAAAAHPALHAQDSAAPAAARPAALPKTQQTGGIDGRVYFPGQDRYLERVRVSIDGTDKVTFTDDSGTFHFFDIPAGTVKMTVFFTGFAPQSRIVTVEAGATTTTEINLSVSATNKGAGESENKEEVVQMQKFVVNGSREDLGAAIADQEQRYAPNMKTVVSTDEFGANPTGNIGDFLRNLPGVEVDIDEGGEARWANLSGAGAAYVPVQLGGFDFASASSEGLTDRRVQMQQFGMNNLTRLEVEFAPTPESPGDALGGRINMVPRKAFESKRAKFDFSTYLIMNSREFTLGQTPGPYYEKTKKTRPSWSFNYTNPVSKNFGFTISGAYNFSSIDDFSNSYTWRGISSGYGTSSGETYPAPNVANPYASPYISQYRYIVNTNINERTSAAITADWRLGRADRLSFGLQYAYMSSLAGYRGNQFTLNNGLDFTFTTVDHVDGNGYTRATAQARKKTVTTWMPTITYSHIGSLYRVEAGMGLSRSDLEYTDTNNGFFYSVNADRGNLRIVMDKNAGEITPHNIQTYDLSTGEPVDYHYMDQYVITQALARPAQNSEERRTYYANIRRDLSILGAPVSLKAGMNVAHRIRDDANQYVGYQFTGADGIYPADSSYDRPNSTTTPATSDNDAAGFQETIPFTLAGKLTGLGDFEFLNNALVYNLYAAHPSYFRVENLNSSATSSTHLEEIVSAGFLRGDVSFFNNKLYIVGGARFEQTHVTGEGSLHVPAANGVPAHYVARGAHNGADYSQWFPSVNVQYRSLDDRLVFRASWFKSIGRPGFGNYNGGVNLPSSSADPFTNYISVSNPRLKPWLANTLRGEITYYFATRGQLSVSAFTRDYTNYWQSFLYVVTDDVRVLYGLGPEYSSFFIQTQDNSPYKFTMRELTISYRQALAFLPSWAAGINVFAGMTWRTKSGVEAWRMTGSQFSPRSFKAGLSFNRNRPSSSNVVDRISANLNWAYRSRYRSNVYASSTTLEPGTREYGRSLVTMDFKMKFRMTRNLSLTAQIDNLLNRPYSAYEVVSPSTPGGPKLESIRSIGIRYTFGIDGSF